MLKWTLGEMGKKFIVFGEKIIYAADKEYQSGTIADAASVRTPKQASKAA
jgi:hypothetical protein